MGKLSDVISEADKSQSIAEEVRENLHVLMSLTESKLQQFQDEIVMDLKTGKTSDDLTIPITKCVGTYAEARAITTEKTSDVLKKVGETIGNMVSDHSAKGIISGMAEIATQALDAILGAGYGMERNTRLYMVTPDYPAIVRYDFACWARTIEAKAIRDQCQSALACVIYKSAVDVSKLSFNDFLAVYSPVLNAAFGDDPSKLKEMVKEARETYDQFKQDNHMDRGNEDTEPFDMENALKIVADHVKPQGIILSDPEKATVGDF